MPTILSKSQIAAGTSILALLVLCRKKADGTRYIDQSKFYGVLRSIKNFGHDMLLGRDAFQERATANPKDFVSRLFAIVWPRLTGSSEETAGRFALISLFVSGALRTFLLLFSARQLKQVARVTLEGDRDRLALLTTSSVKLIVVGLA